MLQNIRDNMQGTMAKVIIGIIIVPFAAFGIDSLLSGSGSKDVAEVNGEEISEVELQRAIQLEKRQMLSRMGDKVDYAQLEDSKLRGPAMKSLVQRELMLQQAKADDLFVSDLILNRVITETSEFQKDGKFSQGVFEAMLRGAGFTPAYYKELLSTEFTIKHLASPYTAGGFVTQADLATASRYINQTRDIRYLTLSAEKIRNAVDVSQEDLQAYYDAHQDDFYSEEKVDIAYLEVNRSDFYQPVDESEIKAVYEKELKDFDKQTRRRVSHILIEIDDDTTEVQAKEKLKGLQIRLKNGEDFAKLAKEKSEDIGTKANGGDLGYTTGDSFPEPFETALLDLKVNEVSEPVKTEAGLHLIKLTDIDEKQPPSYADSKKRIEESLQKIAAEEAYVAQIEKLADLTFNAADLAEPALELGLQVKTTGLFTRNAGVGIAKNELVRSAAFSEEVLQQGNNSEVIEISDSQVLVLRAKQHLPSALQSLDQVAKQVEQRVRNEKAKQVLTDDARNVIAALKGGKSIEAVASAQSLEWQAKPGAKRNGGDVPWQVLQKAFDLPRPGANQRAVDSVERSNGDVVVVVVANVKDGEPDADKNQIQNMKRFMDRNDGMASFEAFQKYTREKADVEIL